MLELFTLGADRGYNQADVIQNARALTGWTNDWERGAGPGQLPVRPGAPRRRRQDDLRPPSDASELARQLPAGRDSPRPSVVLHRQAVGLLRRRGHSQAAPHASSSTPTFAGGSRDPADRRGDPAATRCSTKGRALVTPPVVWTAGLLRASRQTITTTGWAWIARLTGQVLFQPPNVVGLGLRAVARHVALGGAAGGRRHGDSRSTLLSGKTYPYGIHRERQAGLRARDRLLGRTGRCRTPHAQPPARVRPPDRTRPEPDVGAGRVPAATPERAAEPDPDDPGLDDRMSDGPNAARCRADHCEGFTRVAGDPARARERQAAGGARVGLADADPSRRRRSTAAASSPARSAADGRRLRRGSARPDQPNARRRDRAGGGAAARRQPDPRLALPAGRSRRDSRCSRRPATRCTRSCGRRWRSRPARACRSARTRASPGTHRRHRSHSLHNAGKVTRVPGHRLREPGHVALHLPPLLGGRAPPTRRCTTGWMGRYLDVAGNATNPFQGLSMDGQMNPPLATARNPMAAIDQPNNFAV